MNIPATSIAVEALFYPEADFDDFREGRRDSFVHAPNVVLNAQKSHRFAEAFVARWLRQTCGATVWAGTVSFFGPVTKRHVCTKDVLDRLSSDCGRERVERLRVSSPRLVTPDVIVRLPKGSWQFIEVKRTTDWPPRDEQLRALAYLQWLGLGCVSVVRLLPEGQTYGGPTAIDVKPFSVSLDPDAPSAAL